MLRFSCTIKQPRLARSSPMNETLAKLNRVGWWIFIPFVIFVSRLTWEKTYLTWKYGSQNIGFALAHGPFALFFITPLLSLIWTLVMLIQFVFRSKEERKNTDGKPWRLLVVTLITWSIFLSLDFI